MCVHTNESFLGGHLVAWVKQSYSPSLYDIQTVDMGRYGIF